MSFLDSILILKDIIATAIYIFCTPVHKLVLYSRVPVCPVCAQQTLYIHGMMCKTVLRTRTCVFLNRFSILSWLWCHLWLNVIDTLHVLYVVFPPSFSSLTTLKDWSLWNGDVRKKVCHLELCLCTLIGFMYLWLAAILFLFLFFLLITRFYIDVNLVVNFVVFF